MTHLPFEASFQAIGAKAEAVPESALVSTLSTIWRLRGKARRSGAVLVSQGRSDPVPGHARRMTLVGPSCISGVAGGDSSIATGPHKSSTGQLRKMSPDEPGPQRKTDPILHCARRSAARLRGRGRARAERGAATVVCAGPVAPPLNCRSCGVCSCSSTAASSPSTTPATLAYDAGEHQVGIEKHHRGTCRHRHRAQADPRCAGADRHLLSRNSARPGSSQTHDHARTPADDAIGSAIDEWQKRRPVGAER